MSFKKIINKRNMYNYLMACSNSISTCHVLNCLVDSYTRDSFSSRIFGFIEKLVPTTTLGILFYSSPILEGKHYTNINIFFTKILHTPHKNSTREAGVLKNRQAQNLKYFFCTQFK